MLLICLVGSYRCSPSDDLSSRDLRQLNELYERKDYFGLRDYLQDTLLANSPYLLFYKAAVERAFNHPGKSNFYIDKMLNQNGSIPDSLVVDSWMMKMDNHLRNHSYARAFHAADTLLSFKHISDEREKDIRNTRLIAKALYNVSPQEVIKHGDTILNLKGTHLDLKINGHKRDYAYDTGANYSILMQSEAEKLDIRIFKTGIDVGTSTGKTVKGHMGVADSLVIGNVSYSNVVFLVFPDEALTFPGGFQLRGIIGFPVLEALGELQFRDGTIFIPEHVPDRKIHNMALQNLTPLIEFRYKGENLIGRFDSGASRTVFYESFYRRFIADSLDTTLTDTVRAGGVGGVVKHPVIWLENVNIAMLGTSITLDSTYVHTAKLNSSTSSQYLYANIGLDIIQDFGSYILNFRDMSLVVQ